MVRSQFIKTAFTFAAGTGVGFVANAKYHGQGKASKMIKVLINQTKVVSANFNESLTTTNCELKSTKVDIGEITRS